MLNEAWRLSQALVRANVTTEAQHPLIKPLPTTAKHLLRVRLNNGGAVTAVEDVSDEQRMEIKRIVQTSDGSFPVLKVNQPFLSIPGEAWESARNHPIETCVDSYDLRGWNGAGHNWTQSRDKASLLIRITDGNDASPMAILSRRFLAATDGTDDTVLTRGIIDVGLAALRQGQLSSEQTLRELLVGKGKDKDGKDKKIAVILVLDLDQASTTPSVYERQVWQKVASMLPMNIAATQRRHEHHADHSAFKSDGSLLTGPFPQVKLPVLNAYFPLVSMASDGDKAKCNKRYGLTEYTVVPVSEQAALRMQDALAWIVHVDREGQTWRSVANGRDERDLLIAFVEDKPHVDAKTARYLSPGQDVSKARFEIDATAIAKAFNADPQVRPKSTLHFFLIHKASDGQAQIALAASPTVQELLDAAERWVGAVEENAPHVRLWLPGETRNKKKLEACEGKVWSPYPDQVARLLSEQWVDGGRRSSAVAGPALGEVLHLMLRTEGKWEPAARRMLDMFVQRLTPLLIGAFGAQHAYGPRKDRNKREPLSDYPRSSREAALRAVAVAAILLDALGERKERYMNKAPFQVGQMLALADTLHKDYCTVVRNGQLPNSLIGSALMRRALENPAAALADLGERMMEYLRWAKTVATPKGHDSEQQRIAVNEARKKLRQYQPLATALGAVDLPTELDDIQRAQLLLGFLSAPPSDEDIEKHGEDIK